MFESIKREASAKDQLINEMIEIEWRMFNLVQNQGGRAQCQDDAHTFYVMRYSQFYAWPLGVLSSYRQDLYEALQQGRNPVTEKYAYMMAYTAPDIYNKSLKPHLPIVSSRKQVLIDDIVDWMMEDEVRVAQRYPNLTAKGRPLLDSDTVAVSIRHYAQGEFKTYSVRTLTLFWQYLQSLSNTVEGGLAVQIYQIMISFYGYASLEEANKS